MFDEVPAPPLPPAELVPLVPAAEAPPPPPPPLVPLCVEPPPSLPCEGVVLGVLPLPPVNP